MFTVLIIAGSIAAANSAGLVSVLRSRMREAVIAVPTPAALNFISVDVLRHAGGASAVITEGSAPLTDQPNHIWLAENMTGLLVYAASANYIGRVAAGLASDTASLVFLAGHDKPRLIAPSMNRRMWSNPLVQQNVATLRRHGVGLVPPEDGQCRDVSEIAEAYLGLRQDRAAKTAS